MSIIADLLPIVDDILGVRDSIGAVIHPIFLVTRTWSGPSIGHGSFADVSEQVLPTPQIVALAHNFHALEAGNVGQGDILLKNISKNAYPSESAINGVSAAPNVEKFYRINSKLYQVISVTESYLTWNVQLRKLSHAQGYD